MRNYPEWAEVLTELKRSGRYPRTLPSVPNGGTCAGVAKVTSYDDLKAAVVEDSTGFWRDGTAAGAPQMTLREHATLNAGEILSLLAGRRGVTMVQQWVGWDDENTGPRQEHVAQPVVGAPDTLYLPLNTYFSVVLPVCRPSFLYLGNIP